MPPVDGRTIKAATFSSNKWGWLAGDVAVFRGSIGRHGDEGELQRPDTELVEAVAMDLREAVGLHAPLLDAQVTRWGGALAAVRRRAPRPGRPDPAQRVDEVAGLEVCGAAFDGVGIPAVIADADAAATRLLDDLGRCGDNGAMTETPSTPASARPGQGRARAQRRHPLHDVVGLRAVRPGRRRRGAAGGGGRGREPASRTWRPTMSSCAAATTSPGLRADADVMVWWHASTAEALQAAYNRLRRTAFGARLVPVWSQMALHRPAEFNKSHVPAFLADERPRDFICVYPFVRSYEWYLLEDKERRAMLAEHGQMAREFADVRANTVASFALGDYEWILAFEADELHRIVDLMRHLRGSTARRHVREEVPFYTGRRRTATELITRAALAPVQLERVHSRRVAPSARRSRYSRTVAGSAGGEIEDHSVDPGRPRCDPGVRGRLSADASFQARRVGAGTSGRPARSASSRSVADPAGQDRRLSRRRPAALRCPQEDHSTTEPPPTRSRSRADRCAPSRTGGPRADVDGFLAIEPHRPEVDVAGRGTHATAFAQIARMRA